MYSSYILAVASTGLKLPFLKLSRQLQLRLQYARLKVDHGWVRLNLVLPQRNGLTIADMQQKQNLNEVENLYFHHSHQRGPQPYPSPSLIATTQREATSLGPILTYAPQSSLSFRLGPTTLSRSSTPMIPNVNTPHPDYQNSQSNHHRTQAFSTHSYSDPHSPGDSSDSAGMKTYIPMDADRQSVTLHSAVPAATGWHQAPRLASKLSISRNNSQLQDRAPTPSKAPSLHRTDTFQCPATPILAQNSWSSHSSTSTSSPSYSQYSSSGIPRRQSTATMIADSPSSSGSSSVLPATPSLTYDSFWSSHQTSRKIPHPGSALPPIPTHPSGIDTDSPKENATGERPGNDTDTQFETER